MITSGLIYFFTTIFSWLIALLPTGDLPTDIIDGLEYIILQALNFNELFPFIGTLLTIITLGMTIELAWLTWRGIQYIINIIRGSGA